MTGAAEVVAAARGHLGTAWQHQARLPGVAMDCAGLVICVARQLGLVAPDFDVNGYARAPDGSMLRWCEQHMQRLAEIELGAVLVFVTSRAPQHLGIAGDYRHGGWSVIHSTNAATPPRVVETRLMLGRTFHVVGVYRLPGVH